MKIINDVTVYIVCINLAILSAIVVAWGVNLYKLTQCDFEAPYKGEVIHAVGLIGPTALITVWFDVK